MCNKKGPLWLSKKRDIYRTCHVHTTQSLLPLFLLTPLLVHSQWLKNPSRLELRTQKYLDLPIRLIWVKNSNPPRISHCQPNIPNNETTWRTQSNLPQITNSSSADWSQIRIRKSLRATRHPHPQHLDRSPHRRSWVSQVNLPLFSLPRQLHPVWDWPETPK